MQLKLPLQPHGSAALTTGAALTEFTLVFTARAFIPLCCGLGGAAFAGPSSFPDDVVVVGGGSTLVEATMTGGGDGGGAAAMRWTGSSPRKAKEIKSPIPTMAAAAAMPWIKRGLPCGGEAAFRPSTSTVMGGGSEKSGATGNPTGRRDGLVRDFRSMTPSSFDPSTIAVSGAAPDDGVFALDVPLI